MSELVNTPQGLIESGLPVRLNRDLRNAARTLTRDEVQYIVAMYYTLQKQRIATGNRLYALSQGEDVEPHETLAWFKGGFEGLEKQVPGAMRVWCEGQRVGRWALGVCGIGPVLAAGLLAHIDIQRAPTAGAVWRFAGLDPTLKWLGVEAGARLLGEVMKMDEELLDLDDIDPSVLSQDEVAIIERMMERGGRGLNLGHVVQVAKLTNHKLGAVLRRATNDKGEITKTSMLKFLARRPYNAKLKVLCWKIGESFKKVSGNEKDIYGHVYRMRKELEIARNESGAFAGQATAALTERRIVDAETRACYEAGKLPKGRLDLRAMRYAVKLFLSHLQHVMFEDRFGVPPPKPYVFTAHPELHVHFVAPPDWPCE